MHNSIRFFYFTAAIVFSASSLFGQENATTPANSDLREFFEARIRPVLIEQCYECHNSHGDSDSDLALDHRDPLVVDRGGKSLIVPGKPKQSRLLSIIRHEVDGLEMPDGRPKLDDETIADFEKWITDGAFDPRDQPPSKSEMESATSWAAVFKRRKKWWSFQPIADIKPPKKDSTDLRNPLNQSDHPIDRFVATKQNSTGLPAGPPADPSILVRRVFFALIGLPPTAEQAQTWTQKLTDNRDDAFAKLVDELLASKHFGERWARHWMDWIRYAESHGSEGDPKIDNAWLYRDYLIRALNQDVSFDQLVREHIAGDLIEHPRKSVNGKTNESIIGPAHWRMVFHGFAPTDALDEKVRFVDDQVNSFSKAFLGLTVSCARCHDHKFDAISQEDYYALFGILSACRPARHAIEMPDTSLVTRKKLSELKPRIRQAIATDWLDQSNQIRQQIRRKFEMLDETKPVSHDSIFHPLWCVSQAVEKGNSPAEAWPLLTPHEQLGLIFDERVRLVELEKSNHHLRWHRSGRGLSDANDDIGQFAVSSDPQKSLMGIYPAGIYSHIISDREDARLTSPDFKVTKSMNVWMRVIGDGGSMTRYVVEDYPRSGTVYPVPEIKPAWRWQKFDLKYWEGDNVHLEVTTSRDAPLLVKPNSRSWFGVRTVAILPNDAELPRNDREHLLPILRTRRRPTTVNEAFDVYQEVIVDAINRWMTGTITSEQCLMLDAFIREGILVNTDNELQNAERLLKKYRELESQLPTPTRVPGLETVAERQQALYTRGDHKKPAGMVAPRFLSAFGSDEYDRNSSRLQLADDVLRHDNPLTRRVIVNRLWHHLFGQGIVSTPDNFGKLGAPPSHPEMLDWLAHSFEQSGGSIKSMIRQIVNSKTWQLSSVAGKRAMEMDPENHLLTHANVRRLDAEAIRDSMLSVSGRLEPTLGGEPVGGNAPRRSIYVRVIRNSLDPLLRVFDFPEPFATVGRRDSTNVPAQSLTLINDPFVAQLGKQWADRHRGKTIDEALPQLFWTAFSRPPTDAEHERIKRHLESVDQHQASLRERLEKVVKQSDTANKELSGYLDPVRERLINSVTGQEDKPDPRLTENLIASWDFTDGLIDQVGDADVRLIGQAKQSSEGLVVDRAGGPSYAVTDTMSFVLREKTLIARVRLSTLDQRAGGVITVQTPDGVIFDSIVFAEKSPRRWLAGSNGFSRTESFSGPRENDATNRFIHVAIVYHADGRIEGFRDGELYGKSYRSSGLMKYEKNNWVVSFGVRHLPAGGNRLLSGTIAGAQIFDAALSPEKVLALSKNSPHMVSEADVLAELLPEVLTRVSELKKEIARLDARISELTPQVKPTSDAARLTELTRSMFLFKEFIYLR